MRERKRDRQREGGTGDRERREIDREGGKRGERGE